jgi:hypothetical protein
MASLPDGYARDILAQQLEDNGLSSPGDCDALFRTLMLDENWTLGRAKTVYYGSHDYHVLARQQLSTAAAAASRGGR